MSGTHSWDVAGLILGVIGGVKAVFDIALLMSGPKLAGNVSHAWWISHLHNTSEPIDIRYLLMEAQIHNKSHSTNIIRWVVDFECYDGSVVRADSLSESEVGDFWTTTWISVPPLRLVPMSAGLRFDKFIGYTGWLLFRFTRPVKDVRIFTLFAEDGTGKYHRITQMPSPVV